MKFRFSKIILSVAMSGLCLFFSFTLLPAQEFPEKPEDSFGQMLKPGAEKKLVIIPNSIDKEFVDAEDLRDPFFLMRGYRESSEYVLEPGTSIDGIKFNSYANANVFIERYYRESNFALNDVYGKIVADQSRVECMHCHQGIEQISENHNLSCQNCHLGNPRSRDINEAHRNLVTNPSDLKHADKFCGKCHGDHIDKVKNSLMATANGIRNITRYAWGAGANPLSSGHEAALLGDQSAKPPKPPAPHPSIGAANLVDDFLEKKCLRCHIQSPAPNRAGDYRATGCAACHMIYANDGITLSRDRAIQRTQRREVRKNPDRFKQKFAANSLENKRGYPVLHKFTVAVPSVQCEHCHNNNGAGSEYEGLFGKPARPKPGRNKIDADKPALHGRQHEFLLPDIHREKNMHCIDCHSGEEIKGGTAESSTLHDTVKIRCEDCHGTNNQEPEGKLIVESDPALKKLLEKNRLNPNLKGKVRFGDVALVSSGGTLMTHIKKEGEQWVLFSKVTGKKHIIPVLKNRPASLAHSLEKHMTKIECHACHARWSATEWGLHAVLEDSPNPLSQREWNFSDPTLQYVIANPSIIDGKFKITGMLNWETAIQGSKGIKGDWKPGVWLNVLTEADWSTQILGINGRGKYNILKPQYQFFITDRREVAGQNQNKLMVPTTSDGNKGFIMAPHAPHTIRRTTRSCESCHSNPLSAGLGDLKYETVIAPGQFRDTPESRDRLLPQLQLKQMISETGDNLQTPLPFTKIRFLTPKEIESLKYTSETYKAYRYLDLRNRNFPRLLVRESFPYDNAHAEKEKTFGLPDQDEDIFYDKSKHRFTTLQTPESHQKPPNPADLIEEDDSLTEVEDVTSSKEFSREESQGPDDPGPDDPGPASGKEEVPEKPGDPEQEQEKPVKKNSLETRAEESQPTQETPAPETPQAEEQPKGNHPGQLLEDFLKDLKLKSQSTAE